MRMTDRLIKDTQRKERMKNQRNDEDGDETLTYAVRMRQQPIYERNDIFDSKLNEGINTQQSVFDRTAVFRNIQQNNGE